MSNDNKLNDIVDGQTKWLYNECGKYQEGTIYAGLNCRVARAIYDGSRLVGSLIEGEKCVYLSSNNTVYEQYEYQVFEEEDTCTNMKLEWKWASGKIVPEGAIVGGSDGGNALFIGRTAVDGRLLVGSYRADEGKITVGYKKNIHIIPGCDILCKVSSKS